MINNCSDLFSCAPRPLTHEYVSPASEPSSIDYFLVLIDKTRVCSTTCNRTSCPAQFVSLNAGFLDFPELVSIFLKLVLRMSPDEHQT